MKCFVANVTLVGLFSGMSESVILVVALLMEPLATVLTHPGFVAIMDPHVGVEGGASVEGLATGHALVRLLIGVDDFVSAESGGLTETLPTNFTNKRSGSLKHNLY